MKHFSPTFLLALGCLAPCFIFEFAHLLHPFCPQGANLKPLLIYNRDLILNGELWRMWTGHFVHFGPGHFWPNIGSGFVLIWMLQRVAFLNAVLFPLLMPPFVSLFMLIFAPDMEEYAGFSGLVSSWLVWCCLERFELSRSDVLAWLLISGFAAKLFMEFGTASSLLGTFNESKVRVEPLAHLGGAIGMFALWFTYRLAQKGGIIDPLPRTQSN
ncbi:MAG: rhombosortase [Verrucomicrobiales bacterium]